MKTFLGNFESLESVIKEYNAPADALDGAVIHMAWYGCGSYDGSSLVVFEKEGKLFEVNGSHCSCYGLEDQWSPEETSWEALAARKWSNYSDGEVAGAAIAELCKSRVTA